MKRIALIGLENSGKSVFLTSFYKNLEDKIQKGGKLGGKDGYERVVRLDEDKRIGEKIYRRFCLMS